MQAVPSTAECIQKFKPLFKHVVYQGSVDVVGKHISGLLTVKLMPDSSIRFVFSSETGLSFFDFGFLTGDRFKVYSILPQMNKKAVIKTLRKDFELIMFRNIDFKKSVSLKDSLEIYHGFRQSSGINYYVTDTSCSRLIKMQRSSDSKAVMEAIMEMNQNMEPDSIAIRHLNFNFTISLKKIPDLVAE